MKGNSMTETERKALALVNEVRRERNQEPWKDVGNRKGYGMVLETLCRAIEQHEAFRTEVSDAVEELFSGFNDAYCPWTFTHARLDRFIITKPDPLVEAVGDAMQAHEVYSKYELTDSLRAALAARGLKIVEDRP